VAFAAKGGTELERTTFTEIFLTIGGGIACAIGILFTARSRPRGAITVALFVLLALITALSIDWSIVPGESWIETNRTLAYVAVFGGAVALGNLGPGAAELVLRALLAAATVVVGYALISRVWPAQLAELEIYARIGQPFGYWNAVGVTAAFALPLALALGARRTVSPAVSALAFPVTGLMIIALFLTYSRSALLGALIAVALWLVFVPLRLRSAAVLITAGVGAAPVLLWATSKAAFTDDGVALAVREDVATEFGVMLLVLVLALYAVGYAFTSSRERMLIEPDARRAIGQLLVGALVAAALVGVGAVALSERGLGGTVSDRWEELTDDSATTDAGPSRLAATASSRSRYWRQAIDVFEEEPLAGVGAGGFATAALRFRDEPRVARHAHGYPVQTLADLGVLGLLVSVALGLAWLVAALRAVGATPRSRIGQLFLIGRPERVDHDRAPAWTDDRIAVTALFLAAIAYGIQSALDWTWFVPGPTVMALVAAGFVAGRGPAPESAAPAEPPPRARVTRVRAALALGAVLAALAASWSIWQPERADDKADEAIELSGAGDFDAALDAAHDAQDIDSLSIKPLFAEAAVYQREGRNEEALDVFRRAALEHEKDPQAWLRLADFQIYELNDPEGAVAALDQALYLDPVSEAIQDSFIEARQRLRQRGIEPEVSR
jgi:O-antigen ligase